MILGALLLSACQPVMTQTSLSASSFDNKDFILRYFAALNKDKSPATVDEYVVDEVLKHHIDMFEAAFPGYQLHADEMISEGDNVFVRTTFEGTHEGDLMDIPPTGLPVTIAIALTYKIEDGKIVDHWMLADKLTMMQQIGVIPAPRSGPEEEAQSTLDRIELPVGFRPEGITLGSGSTFYVGSLGCCGDEAPGLVGGAIYRGDLRTGEGEILVAPQAGQMAVGITFDPRTNYLFVAGGLSRNLLVFDAQSGGPVGSYQPGRQHISNDLVVTPDAVFITDSFSDKYYRLPLGEGGTLPRGKCADGHLIDWRLCAR